MQHLKSNVSNKLSTTSVSIPMSAPSVKGVIALTTIELVGLFPSNTLCGRIFFKLSPDSPDFSSSDLASSFVFPFIRASVWAKKFANSIWNHILIHELIYAGISTKLFLYFSSCSSCCWYWGHRHNDRWVGYNFTHDWNMYITINFIITFTHVLVWRLSPGVSNLD